MILRFILLLFLCTSAQCDATYFVRNYIAILKGPCKSYIQQEIRLPSSDCCAQLQKMDEKLQKSIIKLLQEDYKHVDFQC
jgi:hypothetical protein